MTHIDWNISTPPLPDGDLLDLIRLWRTEWKRGDFDWVSSLSGDYAETLRLSVVTGREAGRLAVTATAVTREGGGEIGLISSVMTADAHRGRGLGAEATERAVAEAQRLGASVAYLGTNTWPRNVYQKIGFEKWNGIVMRRALVTGTPPEEKIFAPGQAVTVREAQWGDAPAFVALVLQPLGTTLLSLRRSLVSPRFAPMRRCVSNFAPLFEDCLSNGGKLLVLAGRETPRIFGFASWIPQPGGLAWIEAAAHDAYADRLTALLEQALAGAASAGLSSAFFWCHPGDEAVRRAVLQAGFQTQHRLAAPALPSQEIELFKRSL